VLFGGCRVLRRLPEFWVDDGSLPGDFTHYIPGTQDKAARPARKSSSLGFAGKYPAQLMDEILTLIPIDLRELR
jgi:hypothetical protein